MMATVAGSRASVLIVDDAPSFRSAVSLRLSLEVDFCIVGEAGNGAEAVAMVADRHIDIVLMDIHMPILGGVPAASAIHEQHPRVRIVLMSTYAAEDLPVDPSACGAIGYLHKEAITPASIRVLMDSVSRSSP